MFADVVRFAREVKCCHIVQGNMDSRLPALDKCMDNEPQSSKCKMTKIESVIPDQIMTTIVHDADLRNSSLKETQSEIAPNLSPEDLTGKVVTDANHIFAGVKIASKCMDKEILKGDNHQFGLLTRGNIKSPSAANIKCPTQGAALQRKDSGPRLTHTREHKVKGRHDYKF